MVAYNFSKEVDDEMATDIGNAERFPDQTFVDFAEMVFQFLTSPRQAGRMMQEVAEFGAENGIGGSALKGIVRAWMSMFRSAQRLNLSPKAVFEDLMQAGIAKKRAQYVGKQYKANLAGMSRSIAGRTLMVSQLVDMEWKFGVAAGSSEVRQSGDTFLQMKLSLDHGGKTEDHFMELTLPQFYSFLQELEKAKAGLQELS